MKINCSLFFGLLGFGTFYSSVFTTHQDLLSARGHGMASVYKITSVPLVLTRVITYNVVSMSTIMVPKPTLEHWWISSGVTVPYKK